MIALAFVPQVGIEDDEALIASAVYAEAGPAQDAKIFGHNIPLMIMSYVGGLKSWIYAPIFRIWEPSPASLRVPVILAGGLTIWLFYRLLLRIAGERAATVGCLLLSADTVFLMTTCFDWGPVVLQHLLLVSGALCLVCFHQEGRRRFLASGFFLLGLALWDKAVFAWILSGMAAAALVVFPKELQRALRPRNAAIAALAFCLGSAPVIFYNIRFPLSTFRVNAGYSTEFLPEKTRTLLGTLSGQSLFGYIARTEPAGNSLGPHTTVADISVRLSEATGHLRSGFFGYALLLGLLLTPWLWLTPARRPLVFSVVTMLVAWLQMLFTRGAGNAAHHAILLWPFPTLLVAVAFAQAASMLGRSGKPLLVSAVIFLASTSALVTNEYYATLVRNGGGVVWTDAIYPLSACLKRVSAEPIYVNDWGIFDTLRMLSRGKLPLRVGYDPLFKPHLDSEETRIVLNRISEPGAVFVAHTDDTEMFKGVNEKFRALAAEAGYRRETLQKIADRNGRIIFEVFRFAGQELFRPDSTIR